LAHEAEPKKEAVFTATGEVKQATRSPATGPGPEKADPAGLQAAERRHRRIEHRWIPVAADGFGEERQVLQDHDRGQVRGRLGGAALDLLRGRCAPWSDEAPPTARAEWVNGCPLPVLAPTSRL
jgi:hypothetical protein